MVVALSLLLAEVATAGHSIGALFRAPALQQLVVSPSGELLASIEKRKGRDALLVRRRGDSRKVVAFKRLSGLRRITWIDDEHVLVRLVQGSYHVVTVRDHGGELETREQPIRASGRLVDLLRNDASEVLWSVEKGGTTSVYRLGIEALLGETGSSGFEGADGYPQVAELKGRVDYWVADREGEVRAAAQSRRSGESEVWYRTGKDDEWRKIHEAEEPEDAVYPLGIAENGHDLIVSSKLGRDTMALYELSPESGQLGRELFSHASADVTDVLYDYTRTVVTAAVYEREGLEEFHHFDPFLDRYQRSLAHALPGVVARMSGVSQDRRIFVIFASGPRDPGTYYVLDTETNIAVESGRLMPWIDPNKLADVEALRVPSLEGVEIEVFLARPETGNGAPPLVVLPHGGPAYVRDTRSFDPLVQSLAAGGLAVLQVNYRGSGGRGQAFLDAGKRQWGTGIEQDLEAALEEVFARGWVDSERVCIAGGSYGGYSALISLIRSPERYRCAASFNGPTDLPYSWESKFRHWDEGREYFEDFIGDPEDLSGLRSISPAYRAAEIQVPVLLVHGTDDKNVDVDHFYRMQAVLEALGRPHETFLIRGGGHSPTRSEWVDLAGRMRKFLTRHLKPG